MFADLRIIDNFPLLLSEHLPNVYHLGFHSKHSFGAASYFVKAGSRESLGVTV